MGHFLKVGLTGGIGSGKSTVASLFEMLGVPVYGADEEAKRLMVEDGELRKRIVEMFGEKTYTVDVEGNYSLERDYLASQIFGSDQRREVLNGLVHPAVARDFERWAERQRATISDDDKNTNDEGRGAYVVEEAAILIESGGAERMDKVIVVVAPEELRIQRVMKRDGVDRERVLARIAAQMSDAERLEYADYVIVADERELLMPQVLKLHEELSAL